jgi:hypothetical protein
MLEFGTFPAGFSSNLVSAARCSPLTSLSGCTRTASPSRVHVPDGSQDPPGLFFACRSANGPRQSCISPHRAMLGTVIPQSSAVRTMIKYVQCLRRHPDLSPADFRQHWEEYKGLWQELADHLMAIRVSFSTTLAIDANEQIAIQRGTAEPFDGLVETWVKDAQDLETRRGPEGQGTAESAVRQAARVPGPAAVLLLLHRRRLISGTVYSLPAHHRWRRRSQQPGNE